jgi:hypothetical protein
MHNVRLLVMFLTYASAIFLVIGLYKPWVMLWWEDTQNRKKVIQLYGSLTVVFFFLYEGLGLLKQ